MKRFICVLVVLFSVFCLYAEPKLLVSENGWDIFYNEDTKSTFQVRSSELPYDILKVILVNYFDRSGFGTLPEDESVEVFKNGIGVDETMGDISTLIDKGYNIIFTGKVYPGGRASYSSLAILTDGTKWCLFKNFDR